MALETGLRIYLSISTKTFVYSETWEGERPIFPQIEYNTYLEYRPKLCYEDVGYKTNYHGFRYDEDFTVEKDSNELRIFITGGSTAWGSGVDQRHTYSSVAEDLFKKEYPQKKIRVINAGVGSYKTVQERILIENVILSFSPDYVIMFSGWNDTYSGYIGADILQNSDYLGIRKLIEGTSLNTIERLKFPAWYDYNIKLFCVVDRLIYKFRYGNEKQIEDSVRNYNISEDKVVKTLLRNVHIISDLSNRFGFRFIFYLQPTLYNTGKKLDENENKIAKNDYRIIVGFPDYNRRTYDKYRKVLPADAQSNAYLFIDGDNAIKNETKGIFSDNVHFGDDGNYLIGKDLFEIVNKELSGKKTIP